MFEKLKLLPCPACGSAAEFSAVEGRIFVACPECGMRGPSLSVTCRNFKEIDGRIDADAACIAAWNALPRKLRFSREKPTEPGAYWYKSKGLLYLCEIHTTFGLTGLFCSVLAGEMARDLAEMDGEWARIPEPEEA